MNRSILPINQSYRHSLPLTRSYRTLFSYLYRVLRGNALQMCANTGIGVANVLLDLAFVWATKAAIDIATHHPTTAMTLRQSFVLLAALMLSRILLSVASGWISAILGVRAANGMRRHVFERLLRGDWLQLRRFHTGDLMNRLETDVSSVVGFVTESVPALITTIAQFIGAFAFLFYMDSMLACVVALVLPFFLLASKLYVKKLRALTHEVRDEDSRIQSIMQETLQHAMVVKTLMRVDLFVARLNALQSSLHSKVLHRARFSTFSAAITTMGFATGYLVAFIWGTVSLEQGTITYGAMIAFIQLVNKVQAPVQSLAKFVPLFIRIATSTERLMALEDIPVENDSTTEEVPAPIGISFRNVTFSYNTKSRIILRHFTHTFTPGSATAIVGETGAGKTTLLRMLFSLVTPQSGEIVLTDGRGHEHRLTAASRGLFCYVPQGNTLFSGTIRSNLLLGDPQASEAEMQEALRLAEAAFVNEREGGLDSPCGETGDGLSEGQAQRIAIARALLAKGKVLVLDEATSALDAETEKRVMSNIIRRFPHTTILFITHRKEVLHYATETLEMKRETLKS